MNYRFATPNDADVLAKLNQQLIRDEGHRNPMNLAQLTERMRNWLANEYQSVLFEEDQEVVGYALFRSEPEYVLIRHFFVLAVYRRHGIGRNAIEWLREHVWTDRSRLRIEVLVGNMTGCAFWRSVGFNDYCLTMEANVNNQRKIS